MARLHSVITGNYKSAGLGVLVFLAIVYLAGLPVEIMVVDAAVYAHIAMEMYLEGDYMNIMLAGKDWLDKPHLQFWLVAMGYEVFGVSKIVYKLPALLFITGAVWYTYLFARRYYSEKHGWFAGIMLLASFHTIISNTDVRAEPYLTFFTIFSLYHLVVYIEERGIKRFVLACGGMACVMMIKGPYTIIPVLSSVVLSLAFTGRWRQIVHVQWLGLAGLTLLFTTPVIYAYYHQFDLHPEKVIFGETAVSGVRFFLWDSQWGRFDSSGPITSSAGDHFFFVHTLLWAFAPWAILALTGTGEKIRALIRKAPVEYYSLFGFLPMFLIFSMSDFQLPHYLNPLFPFLAILAANEVIRLQKYLPGWKVVTAVQWFLVILLFLLTVVIQYFYFRTMYNWYILVVLIMVISWILAITFKNRDQASRMVYTGALAIGFLGFYLNSTFYPELIRYQSETSLANYLVETGIDPSEVVGFRKPCYPAGLKTQTILPVIYDPDSEQLIRNLVFVDEKGLQELLEKFPSVEILQEFEDYRITQLRPRFINRDTRQQTLRKSFLIKIEPMP